MFRQMLKSKIHRATVTEANINYEGSITIDSKLMKTADILPYEKVQVVDLSNGERLETYAIEADSDSGIICLNGAAARLVQKGDKIIIMSYLTMDEQQVEKHSPKVVYVDEDNRIVQTTRKIPLVESC